MNLLLLTIAGFALIGWEASARKRNPLLMVVGIGVVVYAVVSTMMGGRGFLASASSASMSLGAGFLAAAAIMIARKIAAVGLVSAGAIMLVVAGVLKAVTYFLGFSGIDLVDGQATYLMELGPDDSIREVEPILGRHDISFERAFPTVSLEVDEDLAQVYILAGSASSFDEALAELRADTENVDVVELNKSVALEPVELTVDAESEAGQFLANDPLVDQQWAASEINYNEVYQLLADVEPTRKAIVAILDTGVDANHEDLATVFGESDATADQNGHGTHCAGIAGAATNNEKGIASLNWNGEFVEVTSYQALNGSGIGTAEMIAQSIIDATMDGADVISLSLGDYAPIAPKVVTDAVELAISNGAVVLAAAGNSNRDASKHMPSNIKDVISVAAVGPGLKKAPFSNTNSKLARPIAAPGVNILSLEPGGKYGKKSGTSMATPMVAGLVGVMRAINPNLTAEDIYTALRETGMEGVDIEKTGRTIHPRKAIEFALATR